MGEGEGEGGEMGAEGGGEAEGGGAKGKGGRRGIFRHGRSLLGARG